jgi:hypothetical protein
VALDRYAAPQQRLESRALPGLRTAYKLSSPDPIALADRRRLTGVPNTNHLTLLHCKLITFCQMLASPPREHPPPLLHCELQHVMSPCWHPRLANNFTMLQCPLRQVMSDVDVAAEQTTPACCTARCVTLCLMFATPPSQNNLPGGHTKNTCKYMF